MSFIGTRENGWTNAEKHAGVLWQTWACGGKKFRNFSLSKVIERIFFNTPIQKLLIFGKQFQIIFLGKKENLKNF